MAASIGNKNALGNKGGYGKSLRDRKLAADVRSLILKELLKIFQTPFVQMSDSEKELRDKILIKLAGTILPRYTEVTGINNEPHPIFMLSPKDKAKLDVLLDE